MDCFVYIALAKKLKNLSKIKLGELKSHQKDVGRKPVGFLMLSGGIEKQHWAVMG